MRNPSIHNYRPNRNRKNPYLLYLAKKAERAQNAQLFCIVSVFVLFALLGAFAQVERINQNLLVKAFLLCELFLIVACFVFGGLFHIFTAKYDTACLVDASMFEYLVRSGADEALAESICKELEDSGIK
jgi:hypothetical protein